MGKKKKDIYSNHLNTLERFLEHSKLKYLNRAFHIEKYSTVSKLLFYIGLIGLILFILNMLGFVLWAINWFYVIFVIILSGFIFTRHEKYNFMMVLGIFMVLAFIPSKYGQVSLVIVVYPDEEQVEEVVKANETGDPVDISDLYDTLDDLNENPFEDLEGYIFTFIDILNWIVFLAILMIGGSTIGDLITGRWGDIAKKTAVILLSIAIMTVCYGLFSALPETAIRPVWETVGGAWETMLKNVGLASLDQQGNVSVSLRSISNGLFAWIPLITCLTMFSLSFYFRKTDFKSMLFAKRVLEEDTITVKPSVFSIPYAILLFVMGLYIVGYFLITANPAIVIDPLITLIFYLFSIVVIFLMGFKVLILNKSDSISSTIGKTIKWTIFGLMGLFAWFQVFQPVMYHLNLTDTPSGLTTLSQGASIFENNLLEQLFLIAMPETLIFQIFTLGLGNRVYFYFNKTSIIRKEEERLEKKLDTLQNKLDNIDIKEDSISRSNLLNIAKATVLEREINKIREQIKKGKIQKVPYSYFVIPSMISALIGSFLFSWYHSFRRGIDFITWWQNPFLGMIYFGAGFFLSLIAFFSAPASILVHAFNNVIAIILSGG